MQEAWGAGLKTTKRHRLVHESLLPQIGHHQLAQLHCLKFFSLPYEASNSTPPLGVPLELASNGGGTQCHAHLHSVGPCSMTKMSLCHSRAKVCHPPSPMGHYTKS